LKFLIKDKLNFTKCLSSWHKGNTETSVRFQNKNLDFKSIIEKLEQTILFYFF